MEYWPARIASEGAGGVLEYCASLELHPASAWLGALSGHVYISGKPMVKTRLKPWAMFLRPLGAEDLLDLRCPVFLQHDCPSRLQPPNRRVLTNSF